LPVNQWASNGLTPTEYVLRNESDERATLFRAQLETAIHVSAAYLSNDQRRVLVLREIDGIGLKALAAMLSADSIRTARTYLAAHQSLRQAGRPLFRSTGRAPNEISRRCVMSALESLPPSERDAVLLMQLEGYSMHEASAVLETTKTAIGARVYRGMHCLQRFFDARGAVGGK
jgi:DNA-directed RNA polymerase specialized sigma24 family protein